MSDTDDGKRATVPETYLHDGVYASYDGFYLWLSAHEPLDNRTHRIALEPETLRKLADFMERVKG